MSTSSGKTLEEKINQINQELETWDRAESLRKTREEQEEYLLKHSEKGFLRAGTKEFRSLSKHFTYVFCNSFDLDLIARQMQESKIAGRITEIDSIPRGEPVQITKEYNMNKPWKEIKAAAKHIWEDYCTQTTDKPRQKDEIRLPYPHLRQKTIIYSPQRFKVMVCGRRFGKTTAALIAAVLQAAKKPRTIVYYIAPTYRQAKSIAWSMLSEIIGEAYTRKHEQDLVYELHNGSKIYLKGADNPDSLRGTSIHFAILDEYADIKPNVYDEIIRPMLADTRGSAWFLGTPRGYDHFYELWKKANSGELGKDWTAFRLTTLDNPYIPREEIERAKNESDPRAFSQEYLAEFVQFEGLVFPDFNRGKHIKAFDIKKIKGVDIFGIDPGADHPFAVICMRIGAKKDIYVYAEYYEIGKNLEDHAKAIKKIESKNKKARIKYIDPSAKQIALDLRRLKVPTKEAINDRTYGISKLRDLFRSDKIHIHPNCVNLIYELEHHRYKERRKKVRGLDAIDEFRASAEDKDQKDVARAVLKKDDDAIDALRYAVASYYKGKQFKFEGEVYLMDEYSAVQNVNRSFDKVNLDNNKHNSYSSPKNEIAPEFRE